MLIRAKGRSLLRRGSEGPEDPSAFVRRRDGPSAAPPGWLGWLNAPGLEKRERSEPGVELREREF